MKPWYKSYKMWVAIVGTLAECVTVVLSVVLTEPETATKLIGAITPVILLAIGLLIGGHAYTDAAALKMQGAKSLADAMRADSDPTQPGHA